MGNFFGRLSKRGDEGDEGPPEGIRKMNTSVYILPFKKPPSKKLSARLSKQFSSLISPRAPVTLAIDIVFFHGLQSSPGLGAHWRAWSRNGIFWPQTLLAEAFPRARIFSVAYDSSLRVTNTEGHNDEYNIAEMLVQDLIIDEDVNLGSQNRPVILIGHSLGGLVIKNFILYANEKKNRDKPVSDYGKGRNPDKDVHDSEKNSQDEDMRRKSYDKLDSFLESVRGVFYYSTPHNGSTLADFAAAIPGLDASPLLKLMTTMNKEIARLNEDFRKWRRKNKVRVSSLYEKLPTSIGSWGQVVVDEASVREDHDECYSVNQNHFNVCKPCTKKDGSFMRLEQFIHKTCFDRAPRKPR